MTPLTLRQVSIALLKLPLKEPYHLAFGDVTHFDTLIVRARDEDGREGFGEATFLAAYGGGSVEDAWAFAAKKAERLPGMTGPAAKEDLATSPHDQPFAVTAFMSAIEMLEGIDVLSPDDDIRVPLLGPVNATDPARVPDEVEALLAQGYGTLKVKVGFDIDADLKRLRVIQDSVRERALLRLDGNQGYGLEDARRFATELDPAGIELFEQPCPAGDWDAAKSVADVSTVPMMLDESIFGIEDITRARDLGAAQFIKLKLFKMGGIGKLMEGLEHIRACGMEPVLGNGVASDVSCWMEACAAAKAINNAGELNGFLRPVDGIFAEPLKMEGGALAIPAGFKPLLDENKVQAFTVARDQFAG